MDNFAGNIVESVLLENSLSHAQLAQFAQQHATATRYRDALHIATDSGEVWLFDYGVLVYWGVTDVQKQQLQQQLEQFIGSTLVVEESEQYSFEIAAASNRMHADHIQLVGSERLSRLAVSHALAQSEKLGQFEQHAQQVIETNAYIPRALATNGKIPLNRKQLAKLRGVLFSVKTDIVLNFNLLDTPEFFWDYSEYEPEYLLVSRYLDISSRITVLNKKLETIHELLEMLANEQNHKHSSLLEWIIIILIAVEIVLFFTE